MLMSYTRVCVFIFRPTFVHHFISENTIEENIVNLFAADKLRDWEDITLFELIQVFGTN